MKKDVTVGVEGDKDVDIKKTREGFGQRPIFPILPGFAGLYMFVYRVRHQPQNLTFLDFGVLTRCSSGCAVTPLCGKSKSVSRQS